MPNRVGHEADAVRNPGLPLDLDWVVKSQVNRNAAERRASSLGARRSVKNKHQAAWLLQAIACTDLTTLNGDDTEGTVRRLCAKARQPVQPEILKRLGVHEQAVQVGAVCVYHQFVESAVRFLEGTGIPVAAVSAGFPHGLSPLSTRLEEIRASVSAGAQEIDIVISRHLVLEQRWSELYDQVKAFRVACGDAHLKSILATGELATLTLVRRASLVCMMAGSDFIKTSTGKEPVNATLPVGLVMARSIRDYQDRTGFQVGYKPAGGIRTAKQALDWLVLMKEELGNAWLQPNLFRIGASALVNDVERQLEHHITGHYAATYKQPLG